MPTWKFAPTSRNVAADTSDLAFDLGLYIIDDLPVTVSTSTTVTYEGSLSIVTPAAIFKLTLTGTGLTTLGSEVTGGTINSLTLTIAGAPHVTITGLNLSGEEFGNLAIPDFDSTVLLEQFLLSGNDNMTGTALGDRLNGMAGADKIIGGVGADDLFGGAGNDKLYGGGGDDDLFGGTGNDVFYSAQGDDGITSGGGTDRFVFNTPVFGAGTDFIEDFSRVDILVLDNDALKGIGGAGKLAASKFKNINTGSLDANDRIFYDQTGGALWYDPDGSGLKFGSLIAIFENTPRITAADFLIIN